MNGAVAAVAANALGKGGGTNVNGCCAGCGCGCGFGFDLLPLAVLLLLLLLLLLLCCCLVCLTIDRRLSSVVARFSFCSSILRCLRPPVAAADPASIAPTATVIPPLSFS